MFLNSESSSSVVLKNTLQNEDGFLKIVLYDVEILQNIIIVLLSILVEKGGFHFEWKNCVNAEKKIALTRYRYTQNVLLKYI